MDLGELRRGTIDAGFGAAVGVYFHVIGLEAPPSIGLAILAFVLFQVAMAMAREGIERFLNRRNVG